MKKVLFMLLILFSINGYAGEMAESHFSTYEDEIYITTWGEIVCGRAYPVVETYKVCYNCRRFMFNNNVLKFRNYY